MDEPFDQPRCRQLIRQILKTGSTGFGTHARERMEQHNLEEIDVTNVLRGGWPRPGELKDGSWRYCVETPQIAVVVTFRSDAYLTVVTAWRFR